MGLPPGALLGPEQAVRGLRAVNGCLRLRCGQRAVGRHQQQFGLLGGPAMGVLDITDRRVRLGQRVAGQPGRQQHGAPVDAEGWYRHTERPVAGRGHIKAGKGGRQVSQREGSHRAIVHHVDRFQLLAGFGEQALGGREISVGAARRPQRHVNQRPGAQAREQSTPVARAPQHDDRLTKIVQGRRVPAEGPQRNAAAVQHPAQSAAPLDSCKARSNAARPVRRPAREDECYSQAGQHLSFAFRRAGPACQAQRVTQLAKACVDITELAQHDSRGLMSHRGLIRARPPLQNRACSD